MSPCRGNRAHRLDRRTAFTRAAAIGIGFCKQGGARHETSSSPQFPQTRRRTHSHARLAATGVRARLSDAADENRRGLRRRRRRRHHRAPDRPVAGRPSRAALRGREPHRRRRQYRHRDGRERRARRLHAAAGNGPERGERLALRKTQLQFRPRHRSGRRRHPRADGGAGPPLGARADAGRVHRVRQSQSRQGQHGFGRQRQRAAHGGGAVQDDDRRRYGPCALSRPGPGAIGFARRPGADSVCGRTGHRRLRQDRQAARARGDHGRTDA